jgi:hypothetical protein
VPRGIAFWSKKARVSARVFFFNRSCVCCGYSVLTTCVLYVSHSPPGVLACCLAAVRAKKHPAYMASRQVRPT